MGLLGDDLICDCPCHGPNGAGMKHVTACCCPHRFVIPADCLACNPDGVA